MIAWIVKLLPLAGKYSGVIFVAILIVLAYLAGSNGAKQDCEQDRTDQIIRSYEQGFEIAKQNAAFEREVVTIVKETQSDTPVDDSGCRLTDDGLRNLNEFLNTP